MTATDWADTEHWGVGAGSTYDSEFYFPAKETGDFFPSPLRALHSPSLSPLEPNKKHFPKCSDKPVAYTGIHK